MTSVRSLFVSIFFEGAPAILLTTSKALSFLSWPKRMKGFYSSVFIVPTGTPLTCFAVLFAQSFYFIVIV